MCMAKPQRNFAQVFGRLQDGERRGVPQQVREHALHCQGGVNAASPFGHAYEEWIRSLNESMLRLEH